MNTKWNGWRRLWNLGRRVWGPVGSVVFHAGVIVALLSINLTDDPGGYVITPPVPLQPQAEPPPLDKLDPPAPVVDPPPTLKDSDLPEGTQRIDPHPILVEPDELAASTTARGPGDGSGPGLGDGDLPGIQVTGPKGPLVLNTLWGNRRSGGDRRGAIGKYGDPRMKTESAVMNALRWLKKEQKPDGSWDAPPVAMTGFALLCYLAHGETPNSEEFGPTVEKAIKYLTATQPNWPKKYEWAIATYAMSEAYGMTRIPELKEAAYKGVDTLVQGQRPSGGWCYGLTPQDEADDTSVMGWCAQALKAAQLARVPHEKLDSTTRDAIRAFKANASSTGGFGYRGPGEGGLTGVGVLCMQLLGAGREREVRAGLAWLERATCKWNDAWLGAPLYYWYYVTQAKFHEGGAAWTDWNRQFAPELIKNQVTVKKAGADGTDIGYWELPYKSGKAVKDHSTGLVYNTTLCCLMLEVYYKALPTYRPPQQQDTNKDTPAGSELRIEISMPVTPARPAG